MTDPICQGDAVDLTTVADSITEHWSPVIVHSLNGQDVKLARIHGEFVWHKHDDEDEFFLIIEGAIEMHYRDRVVALPKGSCCVVPRGVEHKPVAHEEAVILLFEPAGTRNTGDVITERTREATSLGDEGIA